MHWKWISSILFGIILAGTVHAINHFDFHQLYAQVFEDVDKLFEILVDYVSYAIVKLGFTKRTESNKIQQLLEQYDLMVQRSSPLVTMVQNDFHRLVTFVNNLEIVYVLKKFLYSYFRQSAINLIEHMRLVYQLG